MKAPGFLGSTQYEMLDSPDGLVEIAEWESAEAQAAAVEQATVTGVYAPVIELVAAPSEPPESATRRRGSRSRCFGCARCGRFDDFTHIGYFSG